MERTFAIIKPDAVKAAHAGAILSRIEQAGFRVLAMRLQHLTKAEAEGFTRSMRRARFSDRLLFFMSSGPCWSWRLSPNAIQRWRTLMGATRPAKADLGTAAQGPRRVD